MIDSDNNDDNDTDDIDIDDNFSIIIEKFSIDPDIDS